MFDFTIVIVFKSYVIYQLLVDIDAGQHFRNILGTGVKLSKAPTETFTSSSLVECALKCEMTSSCEAYNLRSSDKKLKICEIFDFKEADIFNKRNEEKGSLYFEKVYIYIKFIKYFYCYFIFMPFNIFTIFHACNIAITPR